MGGRSLEFARLRAPQNLRFQGHPDIGAATLVLAHFPDLLLQHEWVSGQGSRLSQWTLSKPIPRKLHMNRLFLNPKLIGLIPLLLDECLLVKQPAGLQCLFCDSLTACASKC